jgi:hypothetical protein
MLTLLTYKAIIILRAHMGIHKVHTATRKAHTAILRAHMGILKAVTDTHKVHTILRAHMGIHKVHTTPRVHTHREEVIRLITVQTVETSWFTTTAQ